MGPPNPAIVDQAQHLKVKLDSLDAEFKTHHYAVVDTISDEGEQALNWINMTTLSLNCVSGSRTLSQLIQLPTRKIEYFSEDSLNFIKISNKHVSPSRDTFQMKTPVFYISWKID